jgi:hypothetical protein
MEDKTFAIGVTVGLRQGKGGRKFEYFQESLASLRNAGFTHTVFAFCEPGAHVHVPDPEKNNVKIHSRKQKLGCFQNFRHGLKWLMRKQRANWYLMLQDDCIWRSDGAAVFQQLINDPERENIGMLSPYTSRSMVPQNQQHRDKKTTAAGNVPADRVVSCKFYNKAFWGAVAMAFPHAAAVAMDKHPRYANHPHQRKLDVCVGNTLRRELKLDIHMAVPSLCDHIGAISTYGRHKIKGNQWGRKGYRFREDP